MPEGKYFLIRSKLNPSLVLDCERGGTENGTRVITWAGHGGENQQWYNCPFSGTIRSRKSGLCLDYSNGDELVINNHQPGEPMQQWRLDGEHVVNRLDSDKVLDIASGNEEAGGTLCAWNNHGGDNQKFTFESVQPRYFYIVSEMNDKVLDVAKADPSPGTKVVMYDRHDSHADNQLWYEDRNGVIRSKLSELAFDCSKDALECDHLNPDGSQWWLIQGNKIVNRNNPNQCLDICREDDSNGAELCSYDYHAASNQHWRFDYIN